MELFTIAMTLFGSLAAFGLLAVTYGADSRDGMTDDWARGASI